jgi:hypothetical protein
VQLTDIPAGCNGLPVALTVYGTDGVVVATGNGTASTGPMQVTTTVYPYSQVVGVALLVDTWGISTTWTAPVVPPFTCVAVNNSWQPLPPPASCTVTNPVVVLGTTTDPGGTTYPTATLTFGISGLTGNARFIVTADFGSVPMFPGWTPVRVFQDHLIDDPNYNCSQLPIVSVRGRNNAGPSYNLFETTRPTNANPGGWTRICP